MHESSLTDGQKSENHSSRHFKYIRLRKLKLKKWWRPSKMALTLARCSLATIIENSFQLKRADLTVECQEVFLHSLQKKAIQTACYHLNAD